MFAVWVFFIVIALGPVCIVHHTRIRIVLSLILDSGVSPMQKMESVSNRIFDPLTIRAHVGRKSARDDEHSRISLHQNMFSTAHTPPLLVYLQDGRLASPSVGNRVPVLGGNV